MKRHIKILLTATLIVLPALSVAAQGDSIARRGNALDHLLQRRPARQGFGETAFRDHTFLSASLGTSFLFTPDERASSSFSPAGFSAAVAFGKWFTPLSGVRLGVGIGTNRNVLDRRYAYARLSLDYMLNISALASGYDYDRPFEVIGLAGADWMAVRHVGADQWGGHLALQLKWHVSPLVDIYLEPKYGILSDGADGISGWRGYDTQGAVSLGLTYNIPKLLPRQKKARKARATTQATMLWDEDQLRSIIREELERSGNTAAPDTVYVVKETAAQPTVNEEAKATANVPFTLSTILFKLGADKPKDGQEMAFVNIARYMETYPDARIRLDGYADSSTGSERVNLYLSMRRAVNVRDILVNDYGIDSSRIEAQGIGTNAQPYEENDWNRVVIVTVIK